MKKRYKILRDWTDNEDEPTRYFLYVPANLSKREAMDHLLKTKRFHIKMRDIESGEEVTPADFKDRDVREWYKTIPNPGYGKQWKYTGEIEDGFFVYTTT